MLDVLPKSPRQTFWEPSVEMLDRERRRMAPPLKRTPLPLIPRAVRWFERKIRGRA